MAAWSSYGLSPFWLTLTINTWQNIKINYIKAVNKSWGLWKGVRLYKAAETELSFLLKSLSCPCFKGRSQLLWGKHGLQKFQQKLHNISGYKNNEREYWQTRKQGGNAGTKIARKGDFLIWYLGMWKWKALSHVQLVETPRTIQSMEFSRPEYWSG